VDADVTVAPNDWIAEPIRPEVQTVTPPLAEEVNL
jgi:hypothetical protein